MNLIAALETYRSHGRKVVTLEFVIDALKGSYSDFEVTDDGFIQPITKTSENGLYEVEGGDVNVSFDSPFSNARTVKARIINKGFIPHVVDEV